MAEFDLDSFIAGINQDKQQQTSSNKDRLNKVLMNTRDHQGTLNFVPCYSSEVKNFYLKITGVYEFKAETSLLDSGEAWYKILPIEYYKDLSEDEMNLYSEVKGYIDTLNDNEAVSFEEFRYRNYSLFYGICLNLTNTENKQIEDLKNKPCLFIYPSLSVINNLCDSLNAKIQIAGGRKDWIPYILSTNKTGRKGVVQVKFIKAAGPGYDCSVTFEMNSEFATVIDPDFEVTEDMASKFDSIIPNFVGWMYNRDENRLFNPTAFKELRDQLKLMVQDMENEGKEQKAEEPKLENKNDLTKVATQAAAPEKTAESTTTEPEKKKEMPF